MKQIGIRRIGSVLLLAGMVTFLVWDNRPSQAKQYHSEYAADDTLSQGSAKALSDKKNSQSGFTEDKERNRREGILYTIDDVEKVALTSHSGEICVKIPRWKGFSAEWSEGLVGNERCQMTNVSIGII